MLCLTLQDNNSENTFQKCFLLSFPTFCLLQMRFLLLFSRQGKLRLQKWFTPITDREKKKVIRDMMMLVLARTPRSCNFLQWRDLKIVYKRYASLYFCTGLDDRDNELLSLEVLHRYVELLDKYFGNVCELDIIFNFEKAYFILDEFLMGGEIQETSKVAVGVSIEEADTLQETMEEYMSKPAY
ncbi:AP-1 complex subunit sigma-3a isoform X1 [Dicentrarchus labrax]|uniref:AP-1 complex subunit sigma-3a isoform X1 n=1 Tax=Dicentrarchus labrax TaxID=13489 RepID=UPI0021F5E6B8|nr:AP-1 complex subunit sigma-3a isoform X1 [Dicentrarchus labrax]